MTTLSACLIVRDAGDYLDACLEALEPHVDEICVLDTGSVDDSMQIARRFSAKLAQFEWCDDFSAARNVCIELATGEWILMVDADEILDAESAAGLVPRLLLSNADAFMIWIDNLTGKLDSRGAPEINSIAVPRLFRNRPEIRYERPVHESISGSLQRLFSEAPEHSLLRLVHHGYSPEFFDVGPKLERNIAILKKHLVQHPRDVFCTYKLGLSKQALGQLEEARELLDQSWRNAMQLAQGARYALPFLPLLGARLTWLWRQAGQMQRAAEVAQEARADYPNVSEVIYEQAEVERACGRLESAGDAYAAARGCEPWTDLYTGDPETRGCLPMCGLARLSALGGDVSLAAHCVAQALNLDQQHIEARTIAARLASVGGQEGDAWTELSKLIGEAPSNPHVMLFAAEMAWAKQEFQTARGFWLGALENPMSQASARGWLCIADLVEGNLDSAREHCAQLCAADLPEAAVLCVMGAIDGRSPELDSRFEGASLAGEVQAWLGELGRDPEGAALAAFRRGAEVLVPQLGELRVE
jgi:tetratricopeptide (TPR) repeat protein